MMTQQNGKNGSKTSKNGTKAIIVNKNGKGKDWCGRQELSKGTVYSLYNLLVKGGYVLQPAQSNHKENAPKCIQKTEDM